MKILFQGDSITDCGRATCGGAGFETDSVGPGYPGLVKARIMCDNPGRDDIEFVNRAVSGNRIVDLYARWRADALNLAPDVLSILVGVNDVWHEEWGNGVDAPRADRIYREIIAWTKQTLPAVRLVLLEPFALPVGKGAEIAAEVARRAAAVRRMAEDTGSAFVPLQSIFDDACRASKPEHWSRDGVHLTPAGHQLVADAWLRAAPPVALIA